MANEEANSPMGWKEGTWYKCRVKPGASLRESTRSLTPYVGIEFEVITGPMWGEILPGQLYLTPKTTDRVAKALALMGFDVHTATVADWDAIGEKIAGVELEVEPQGRDYKGKMDWKANNFRKVRSGDEPPLAVTVASMFGNDGGGARQQQAKEDEY